MTTSTFTADGVPTEVAALQWLSHALHNQADEIECTAAKLFAMDTWGPLKVGSSSPMESVALTLLTVSRIVVLDERTTWSLIGPGFVERVVRPLSSWIEQLTVKKVRSLLSILSDSKCSLSSEALSFITSYLEDHLVKYVKPSGCLDEAIAMTPSEALSDPLPYRVVPMKDTVGVEEGNEVDKTEIRVEGSVVCAVPLPAFSTFLRVPRSHMFTTATVASYSDVGMALSRSAALREAIEDEEAILMIALVYEKYVKGDASHWHSPLLTSCPSRYPTVPAFWDLNDLYEISGIDVLDNVLARKQELVSFHEQVCAVLPVLVDEIQRSASGSTDSVPLVLEDAIAAFSLEALQWARATFDSRSFRLNIDGQPCLALVPTADMINHSTRSDILVRRVEADGGDFVMESGASLLSSDVGREVWVSYGPLQNWELLQFYGFALDDNENDTLPFPFPIESIIGDSNDEDSNESALADKESPAYWNALRRHLIKRDHVGLQGGQLWIGRNGIPSASLIALLRVCIAQVEDFPILEGNAGGIFNTVSLGTEASIVHAIRDTVNCVLDQFTTTLQEDEDILAAQEQQGENQGSQRPVRTNHEEDEEEEEAQLSENAVLAVRVRMGLKQIAMKTLDWCAAQLEEMEKVEALSSQE